MGKTAVGIVSGIIGAAVGGAAAWFFGAKYWKNKQYEADATYIAFLERKIAKMEEGIPSEKVENAPARPIQTGEAKKDNKSSSIIEKHYNFEATEDSMTPEEEEEFIKTVEFVEEQKLRKHDKPYLVCQSDIDHGLMRDKQMITLDYYRGDDVLYDSLGHKVYENWAKDLGYEWKNSFGEEKYDWAENCAYVGNDNLGILFEILLDEGSYKIDILGYDENDPDLD